MKALNNFIEQIERHFPKMFRAMGGREAKIELQELSIRLRLQTPDIVICGDKYQTIEENPLIAKKDHFLKIQEIPVITVTEREQGIEIELPIRVKQEVTS